MPGPVAGSGDTAVVVRTDGTGDAGGRGIRSPTTPAGPGARCPRGLASGSLTGVAVTGDGTTLLTDSEGVLTAVTRERYLALTDQDGVVYVITRDGAAMGLSDAPELSQLQAVGDRVWGSPGTAAVDRCGGPTTRAPPGTGRRCRACTDAAAGGRWPVAAPLARTTADGPCVLWQASPGRR